MIPFIREYVKLKGFVIFATTHNWTCLIYVSSKQMQKFQMLCRRTSETVDVYLDWFKKQYHNGESDEEEEEEEQEDDGGDDEQNMKTQISAYFNVFLQVAMPSMKVRAAELIRWVQRRRTVSLTLTHGWNLSFHCRRAWTMSLYNL